MKKIISASFVAALSLTMLLPVAGRVNASSVNQPIAKQGGMPGSGNGGGHYSVRQGGMPGSGNGGGHYSVRQGGMPGSGNGGGH